MAFTKTDRACVAADSALSGFTTRRIIDNLTHTCKVRPRSGSIVYPHDDPPLFGCVQEMAHLMWLPLSPEARQVQLHLHYTALYDDVVIGGACTLAPGRSGTRAAEQTLAAGTGTTATPITIDVTGWQAGGGDVCEVQLRIRSTAESGFSTFNLSPQWGQMFGVPKCWFAITGSVSLSESDTFGITPKIGSKIVTGYDTNTLWTVRNNVHTGSGDDVYMFYPFPDDGFYADTLTLHRFSQLQLRAVHWREVVSTPFPSSRPDFPWQDEDITYTTVCPGRQASAGMLGELYRAAQYLATERTTIYSTQCVPRPETPLPDAGADGYLAAFGMAHAHHETVTTYTTSGGSVIAPTWESVAHVPIPPLVQQYSGDTGGVTKHKACDVTACLHIITLHDQDSLRLHFRLRSLDAVTGAVSDTGAELTVDATPVPNNSYTGRVFGITDLEHLVSRTLAFADQTTTRVGTGVVGYRCTIQGLWPLDEVGQTGLNQVRLRHNDAAGLEGRVIELQVKADTRRQAFFVIVSGLICEATKGPLWSVIG